MEIACRARVTAWAIVLALVAPAAYDSVADPALEGSARKTNSLGMVFVHIPNSGVSFCIWETRVQDYTKFVRQGHWAALGAEKPDFDQTDNDPVVNVSWEDAKDFCIWLTQKERAAGFIQSNQVYRLPTDLEWSKSAGLPPERGRTAQKRSRETPDLFEWGEWQPDTSKPLKPPPGFGNFRGATDGFKHTAPVGFFKPNRFGIFDMVGNVWEWCMDFADDGERHVLRGGSWANPPQPLSNRDYTTPNGTIGNYGFRCVLTDPLVDP